MTNKLFVGGLSWGTGDDQLKEAFASFGTVTDAKVVLDHETGRSRGFGFVTFDGEESARRAVAEMDGKDLDGRAIRVSEAQEKPRPSRDGAPRSGGAAPRGGGGFRGGAGGSERAPAARRSSGGGPGGPGGPGGGGRQKSWQNETKGHDRFSRRRNAQGGGGRPSSDDDDDFGDDI